MILGMSNTYQQLVTSLNVDEIRSVLSRKGDSRVGTNSPFAINDKKSGKLKHWLAWILLIMTSLVSKVARYFSVHELMICAACTFPGQLPRWAVVVCGASE
jgi:hypothetical protein